MAILKNVLFTITLSCASICVFAAGTDTTESHSGQQPPLNPTTTTATTDLCPTPNKLVKEGLLWHAPGGWVSYGESFDTQVEHFKGAEWIGINVGKIICLYKGDKRLGFPIALEQKYHKLVPEPSGFQWSKNKGGYRECTSRDIKECPFLFEEPSKKEDIYENLDFFKGKQNIDD